MSTFSLYCCLAFAQVLGRVAPARSSTSGYITRKLQRAHCDRNRSERFRNTTFNRSTELQAGRVQRGCVRPVTKRFSSHCHTSMLY